MEVGERRQLDAPRVDDDERGAVEHRLLDARPDHRMRLGRVGPSEHDQARAFDVDVGSRGGAGAGYELQGGRRRRVADPRAAVDVVGPDRGAEELLQQIGRLIGRSRRGHHAERVRAMCVANLA